MANNKEILEAISAAVEKFGFTARLNGSLVGVYTGKGKLAATVSDDGKIDRKYDGKSALMGALVRDAIVAALKPMAL